MYLPASSVTSTCNHCIFFVLFFLSPLVVSSRLDGYSSFRFLRGREGNSIRSVETAIHREKKGVEDEPGAISMGAEGKSEKGR